MKRIVIAALALAAIAAAGLAALPAMLASPFVITKLQEAVSQATGRSLAVAGPPRLSLWPDLAVEADGVTLSNPPGMFEGRTLAMDTLRVRVSAAALLSRRFELKELVLVRPKLSLVVDGDGRATWDLGPAGKAAGGGTGSGGLAAPIDEVSLAPVMIEDGELRYIDERTGTAFSASKVTARLAMAAPGAPASIAGTLIWNGRPLAVTLELRQPTALTSEGSAVSLTIDSTPLDVAFSGRVRLASGLELAGRADVSSPDLRDLSGWAGAPLADGPGLKDFRLAAGVEVDGRKVALTEARLGLDGMSGDGSLDLTFQGRPRIAARLAVDRIDVNRYAPPAKRDDGGALAAGWSTEAIDFSPLRGIDAKLDLSVGSLQHGAVTIADAAVTASLANGRLDANLKRMSLYGGTAEGRIVLDGSGQVASIQGALKAGDLDGHKLLTDFAGFGRIEGTAAINLSLAATGRTQQELVATLTGTAGFGFADGAVRGINIARLVRQVQGTVLGGWGEAKGGEALKTDFAELGASFAVKDGIAVTDDLRLVGPLVRVTGAGQVDMLSQRLDLRVAPKAVASLEGQGGSAELTGLPVPVVVKGPWASPRIYPDIDGILTDPKAALEALKKLGLASPDLDIEAKAKAATDEVKAKAVETVKEEIGKALGEAAGEAAGEEAGKQIDRIGGSLLKGMFGRSSAPQPE